MLFEILSTTLKSNETLQLVITKTSRNRLRKTIKGRLVTYWDSDSYQKIRMEGGCLLMYGVYIYHKYTGLALS